MEHVEFSRRKAAAILNRTMLSAGYDKRLADLGGWSALWLEDRRWKGIEYLVAYLCLIYGRKIESLRPGVHVKYGISGICPFMLAETVIRLADKWVPRGGISLGAPAEPFLMMTAIADWASTLRQAVRFRHLNYCCLMSHEGIYVETPNSSLFGTVLLDQPRPMEIELTNDCPPPCYHRKGKLGLPKSRLRGGDALDLG